MQKVIHLVVGTFEQGYDTSPAECSADSSTVPPAPKIEKTKVTVSDWTLVSVGLARPVSSSSERVVSVFDRTLALKVTGRWQGASGQC